VALELIHPYNILFYNELNGGIKFYSIDDEGNKSLPKEVQSQKNWTHIIPGNFTGSKQINLFLYSTKTGDASFLTIKKSGGFKEIKHPGWHKGWKEIVPGNFTDSKYTDLLFYNKVNGDAEFYTTNSEGVLQSVKPHSCWYKNGTGIVSGNFVENSYYTDLFIYNASAHEAQFLKTNGKGEITPVRHEPGAGWSGGWRHIVPGNFIHSDYRGLLFHNPSTGLMKIRTTNGLGQFEASNVHTDGPKYSTQVVYLSPE
jgi:hypothetical protein